MSRTMQAFSDKSIGQLALLRKNFNQKLVGSGGFDVQQTQLLGTTERLTNAIRKQDATVKDGRRIWDQRHAILAEQMALQKSMVTQWQRNGAGVIDADLIIPKGLDGRMASFTQKLGLMGATISSMSSNLVNWGKNTQWAGRQLMVGFTVPVIAAGAAFGKFAYQIDQEMTRITKVYGDASIMTAASMNEVKVASLETAKQVASAYGQTAKDTLSMTADLAAAGYQGQQLQQMTAETSRIATLGEIDHQDAIKGTIAIQTVFGKSTDTMAEKTAFLSNTMNYLNGIENQTSLSLQDLFTAIPRAAGPIKQAGGTIQDLAVLLVAAKERGIDAAEAANAIKSAFQRLINPSKQVQQQFKSLTGTDLPELVKQGKGQLIPTLELVGNAVKGLDNLSRQQVLAKLFGTYQYGKIGAMLNGILSKTGQVGKALELNTASASQLADIANQEIDQSAASASGKLKRAVATLQISLAEMGKPFLAFATMFLNVINKVVGAFNGLPDKVKAVAAVFAIFVGLIGPTVMLLGLFVNLVGQITKFAATMVMLGTKFKIINAEERALQLTAKSASGAILTEAEATQVLTTNMTRLTAQIEKLNAANTISAAKAEAAAAAVAKQKAAMAGRAATANMPVSVVASNRFTNPYGPTAVQNRNSMYATPPVPPLNSTSRVRRQREEARYAAAQNAYRNYMNPGSIHNTTEVTRATTGNTIIAGSPQSMFPAAAKATDKVAANMERASKSANKFAYGLSGVAATSSILIAMSGASGKLATSLSLSLLTLSLFPGLIAKATAKLIAMTAASRAGGLLGGITTKLAGIGPMLQTWGPTMAKSFGIAGIAVAGVLVAWKLLSNNIDNTRKSQEKINNSVNDWSKILGYTKTQYAELNDIQTKEANAQVNAVQQLKKANSGLINEVSNLNGSALSDRVMQEALRIRMSGGSKDQVVKGIQTLLDAAGKEKYTATIIADLQAKLNWDNMDQVINQSVTTFGQAYERSMENHFSQNFGEGLMRAISGSTEDLNTRSKSAAKAAADDAWKAFSTVNAQDRDTFFTNLQKTTAEKQAQLFDQVATASKGQIKNAGISNYNDLIRQLFNTQDGKIVNSASMDQLSARFNITPEQIKNLKMAAETEQIMSREMAKDAGATDSAIKSTNNLADARKSMQIPVYSLSQAEGMWKQQMMESMQQGQKLSESEQLHMLNTYRLAAGLDAASTAGAGFKDVESQIADQSGASAAEISKFANNITTWSSALKSGMQGAQGYVLDYAESVRQAANQKSMDDLQAKHQAAADALQNRQQKAQDALDAKDDKLSDKFDKRETAVKNSYDARIQAIKDTQTAEEKADQQRDQQAQNEINRIKRIADAANRTIDFNSAMKSGNFDEAARVMNDAMAAEMDNISQDQQQNASNAATARSDKNDKKISALETQRDNKITALQEQEKAEKKALDNQKKRLKERQDAETKALQASNKMTEDAMKRQQDLVSARFNLELSVLKASTPRTKAEYDAQITAITALYDKYGVNLKDKGGKWTKVITDGLSLNMNAAIKGLQNDSSWASLGNDIANNIFEGGLKMSRAQFFNWVATGNLPGGSSTYNQNATPPPSGGTKGMTLHHEGGPAGGKSSRGGRSLTHGLFRDEIPNVTLQKGEWVMPKKAVEKYGADTMAKMQKGQLDNDAPIGGPSTGVGVPGLAAAIGVAAAKTAIQKQLETVAAKMQASSNDTGSLPDVTGATGNLDLATVMKGIKLQESSGNYKARSSISSASGAYQYLDSTWNNYGGYARAYLAPPAIQDARAQHDLESAYARYKDWEEVIAAHLYPAWANDKNKWNRSPSPGNPTVREYVNGVLKKAGVTANRAAASSANGQTTDTPRAMTVPVSPFRWVRGFTAAHTGIDLAVPEGTPVHAAGAGTVVKSADIPPQAGRRNSNGYGSYGRYIIIDHGALMTLYAHMSQRYAQAGSIVGRGDTIGLSGNTGNSSGPHLHFETRHGKSPFDPMTSGIPGLKVGGKINYDNTIANLHKDEAVLTAPLTKSLENGIKNLESGSNTHYNINVTVTGSDLNGDDVANAIIRKLEQKQKNLGRSRTIK